MNIVWIVARITYNPQIHTTSTKGRWLRLRINVIIMSKITVEIDPIKDFPLDMPIEGYEMWCLGRLRDAGIPVKGLFFFHGLKSGTLVRYNDFETGNIVYVWRE